MLGDTAYGTGQARADLAAAGHTAVIKPGPLRPAVDGGFTIDDFTVDERRADSDLPGRRDPAHHRPPRRHLRRRLPRLPAARALHDQPQTGRTLSLHEHDAILRQARRDWAAREDLRDTYRQHRPMVERSIAWLIGPKSRCRQLRYRGVAKGTSGCTCGWPASTSAG